ncbi:hypothetical protein ACFE04_011154 [Oxalis oulophora]
MRADKLRKSSYFKWGCKRDLANLFVDIDLVPTRLKTWRERRYRIDWPKIPSETWFLCNFYRILSIVSTCQVLTTACLLVFPLGASKKIFVDVERIYFQLFHRGNDAPLLTAQWKSSLLMLEELAQQQSFGAVYVSFSWTPIRWRPGEEARGWKSGMTSSSLPINYRCTPEIYVLPFRIYENSVAEFVKMRCRRRRKLCCELKNRCNEIGLNSSKLIGEYRKRDLGWKWIIQWWYLGGISSKGLNSFNDLT